MNDVRQTCPRCFGDGSYYRDNPGGQILVDPCQTCDGNGYLLLSYTTLPQGVFAGYVVYEAIDDAEYRGLSSPNEEYVETLLAPGAVDLNDGSRARTVLWSLFDSESTTRANLLALLGE
jgi:hypothetical protein